MPKDSGGRDLKVRRKSKTLSEEEMVLLLLESMVTLRWPGGDSFSLDYHPRGIEGKVGKILIIQLSAIGDVVLSTPTIRGLREKYPRAFIAYMVEPTSSEIVEGNPDLDEVVIFSKDDYVRRAKHEPQANVLRDIADFIDSLRERGFDWVLNLNPTPRSAFLTYLIGSRNIIGLTVDETGKPFLSGNIWVLYKYKYFIGGKEFLEEPGRLSLAEINLRMGDVDPSSRSLAIFTNEEKKKEGEKLLKDYGIREEDILIGLNPGSNFETRCWPPERFARLGDLLSEEYGAKIIIFGGPTEGDLVNKIAGMMEYRPLVDIPQQTALKRLAVLLKRCNHLITNDTGPMHIAAACGIPVIAICGPTRVGIYAKGRHIQIQADLSCVGCSPASFCQTKECMKKIEVEIVLTCLRFQRGEMNSLPTIPGINIYCSDGQSLSRLFSYLLWQGRARPKEVIGLVSLNLWIEENRKLGYEEESLSLDEIRGVFSSNSRDFDLLCKEVLFLIEEYEKLCQKGIDLLQNELYPQSSTEKDLEKEVARFNEIERRMNDGVGDFFNFLDHLFLKGQDEIGWRLNLYRAKQEAARYLSKFLKRQNNGGRGWLE